MARQNTIVDQVASLLADATNLLNQGRMQDARAAVEHACTEFPKDARGPNLLAKVLTRLSHFEEAAEAYESAAAIKPDWFVPLANLGQLYEQIEQPKAAREAYKRALQREDRVAELWNNYGTACLAIDRIDEAQSAFDRAIALKPAFMLPWFNLALCHRKHRRLAEAERCLDEAISREARFAQAHRERSVVLSIRRRHAEAVESARQACTLDPKDVENQVQLGNALHRYGDTEAALLAFNAALAIKPEHLIARLRRALAMPVICRDDDEAVSYRQRYVREVAAISALADTNSPDATKALWNALSTSTNFNAHYLGGDFRVEQETFGKLVDATLARCHPELLRLPNNNHRRRDRPRVGFVSSLLREHTVGKLFAAWVRDLDRERFEVVLYDTGATQDAVSDQLASSVDLHRQLSGDAISIAKDIRQDQPDALVFPEVGMIPHIAALAAMRSAPVQALGWGHPITTGLPSMDIFLSSDLMEPPGSEAHYTERLVRLPNLSIDYAFPENIPTSFDRTDFGLSPDRPVALACQSPIKYQPVHDHVFADIAEGAPEVQFAFVAHTAEKANEIFASRLEAAFRSRDLDWRRHCVVVPRLDQHAWLTLNRACDLFIDSIGWSGGNTTLEAIACGLPIVTLAGSQMRARHTAAMLRRIGLDAYVAANVDEYILLTVELLNNQAARLQLAQLIQERRSALYGDDQPVLALADVLDEAIRHSYSS